MNVKQPKMVKVCSVCRNEIGIITAVGLLVLTALTALGTTAVIITSMDIHIGGNYKTSEQAMYATEAGTEEARGRLKADATNPVIDNFIDPSISFADRIAWRAYIGSATRAQALGYDSAREPLHTREDSRAPELGYTVVIKHKTNADGTMILYWGDPDGDGINAPNTISGRNIYEITGYGIAGGSNKIVSIDAAPLPPLTIPAPLYVEQQTNIQGSSTFIDGVDGCANDDKVGVATTLADGQVGSPPKDAVDLQGQPNIRGTPQPIQYETKNMDIQAMVDSLKGAANIKPAIPQSGNLSGQNWGTPTGGAQGSSTGQTITYPTPSTCNETNIVHLNAGGGSIRLTGQTSGCGILLVEGTLFIEGGFNWYGPILVTESVHFTGGGQTSKQITGALLAGGSADADLVGGNTNIVYCSTAVSNQTQNRPLKILSWRELEGGSN